MAVEPSLRTRRLASTQKRRAGAARSGLPVVFVGVTVAALFLVAVWDLQALAASTRQPDGYAAGPAAALLLLGMAWAIYGWRLIRRPVNAAAPARQRAGSWSEPDVAGGRAASAPRAARDRPQADASLYWTYYEHTAESLFVIEVTADGRFVFEGLNPAHQRRTGLTTGMLRGREPADILPPAVAETMTANYRRCVAAGGPIGYEELLPLPGGTRRWETGLVPVRDATGRICRILGSSRDVTERQEFLEALRASEARYRAVVETQLELICRFRPDCTLTFVNDAYCRYFGRTCGELIGTSFLVFLPEEEREGARRQLASLTPERPTTTYEHPVIVGGGEVRWQQWTDRAFFDAAGDVVGYQSVGRDVTDRKRAEEALRFANERLRGVLTAISDCYFTLDRDWRITEINPQAAAWMGVDAEEAVGRNYWEIRPGSMDDERVARLQAAVHSGVPFCLERLSIFRPDRWIETHAYPLADGVSMFFRDITRRKVAEEAAAATRELLQSTLDALTAHIAILDENGTIIAVNAAWRAFAEENGYQGADHGVGVNYLEVCEAARPDCRDAGEVARGLRAMLGGELQQFRLDYPCQCGDRRRWFQLHITRFVSGGRMRLVMAHEDTTEIKRAEQGLRRLAGRLLTSQDEERRRIARELHDSTAQNLLAVSLNLTRLRRLVPEDPDRAQDLLVDSQGLLDQAQREIRTVAYLLHPPALDEAGLVAALEWYVAGFAERSGIRVDLVIPERPGRLPAEIERALFRVVQESLANVHRHSGATAARIRLAWRHGAIELVIADNGRGLPVAAGARRPDEIGCLGVGIPGMRARLRQLGGSLELRSSRRGTMVRAVVARPHHPSPSTPSLGRSAGTVAEMAPGDPMRREPLCLPRGAAIAGGAARCAGAEEAVEGLDEGAGVVAGEGVVDGLGGAAGLDQLVAAQPGEVLGEGRLGQPDPAHQLAHRALAAHQLAQDHQPVLVAERPEQGAGAPRLGLQPAQVHRSPPAASPTPTPPRR